MFARLRTTENRDVALRREKLEDYCEGLPRVAAFLNSDVDTPLFRRFGVLHARVLLYRQIELTALESKLYKLDQEDDESHDNASSPLPQDDSRSLTKDSLIDPRITLTEEISKKLEVYDKLLLREAELRKLYRPSRWAHRNLLTYVHTEDPFDKSSQQFIYFREDFVNLEQHEENRLDEYVQRFLHRFRFGIPGILQRIFICTDARNKTSDPGIHYYSTRRLGTFVKIMIAVISTATCFAPVYLSLPIDFSCVMMISITLACTVVFATALSVFTKAGRMEVFAGTTIYCGILVACLVSLQNG